MIDIHTDPDDSGHDSNFIFDETIDYSAPRFRGQDNPNPSNLTERRWRHPILSAGEVADNLRAARGPEPAATAAKNTLAQAFHRLVLKEVQPYCRDDGRNDDLIAAGMLGLVEAIDGFNLNRNNGFAAYAKPLIRGQLRAAAKAFNRNGWAGETRLQRAVYGNHDLTVEQASKVMGRPVDEGEVEEAEAQVLGMCSEPVPYDPREPAYEDEYDEESKPCFVAVAPICTRQSKYQRGLHQRHGSLEWLAEDADRRATQRLKQIGRRAYTLELVERDRARSGPIEHLKGPRPRGYPGELPVPPGSLIGPLDERPPVPKKTPAVHKKQTLSFFYLQPFTEPEVHAPCPPSGFPNVCLFRIDRRPKPPQGRRAKGADGHAVGGVPLHAENQTLALRLRN